VSVYDILETSIEFIKFYVPNAQIEIQYVKPT